MKQYLVVLNSDEHIGNVGIFEADNPQEAKQLAQEQWNTVDDLYVVNLDGLSHRWSYYM